MKLRSLLYVPAHSERFLARAHERGADAIILDLEDSVPPDRKQSARERLADSVTQAGRRGAAVFVRINRGTGVSEEDTRAACRAGAFGVYVPKVSDPADIAALAADVALVERELGRAPLRFVALIEDPGAVLDVRSIAKAPRLLGLSVGGEDLAAQMGAEPSPEVLRLPKLLVHYAAKAQGLLSFGLLRSTAEYADLAALESATREAAAFGFDGASCVHPSGVPILNRGFSPSAEAVAWAERVLEGVESADLEGHGAFTVDGRMVDAPVIVRARKILDQR